MTDTPLADTLIELASSHEGDFRGAIRSAVRALWTNEWSLSDFLEQMSDAIDRYYEFAWQEGAAAVDVTPEERTDEEQIALYRQMSEALPHISGYAQAIIDGGKANGGALGPLLDRAELWVKRYNEVRNLAMQMAKRDAKLEWVIGPTEEHCFPAGVMIDTERGKTPIEKVIIGDRVLTLDGYKRVTKTFEREYSGELVCIASNDKVVECTSNHPFMTQRGWIHAQALTLFDQVIIHKHPNQFYYGKVYFPNISKATVVLRTKVYNLQVEDVEHYIANGFVVHNCTDCSKYNGRVYRASVWGDIRPQHRGLACHGYQCQCEFVQNSRYPATPGKPPKMTG